MKYLSALGVLVGGFLLHPPPRAVLTTMLWVVSRSHPAVSAAGSAGSSLDVEVPR